MAVTIAARRRLAVLAMVSVCGLAACRVGPSHSIDTSSIERQIAAELAVRYPGSAPTVVCPRRVRAQPGAAFSCSTVIDGQPLVVDGRLTDRSGRFTVALPAAVIDTRRAASILQHQIDVSSRTAAAVTCGPRWFLAVRVGGTIYCVARLAGQPPRPLTATVEDLQGAMRFNLAPLPPGGTATSTARP
jgi:hypothetical protein